MVSAIAILLMLHVNSCAQKKHKQPKLKKMGGVSFVSTNSTIPDSSFIPIRRINADWVSIIPYSFCNKEDPTVHFDHPTQWYGERSEGTRKLINQAKKTGLKVMLKPHVWVVGDGWPGDLDFTSEAACLKWEESYEKYILNFARIAAETKVEVYAVGTECRHLARKRPQYWRELIKKVRSVYSGKVTYAANWDNYENITFWDQVDFIGIDAYFIVNELQEANEKEMVNAWNEVSKKLTEVSNRYNKDILFTEYGFQSIDYVAKGKWESHEKRINLNNQKKAYRAFFESIWNEDWMLGGFLWKWYPRHHKAGGEKDIKFTPQNKPAEEVIRKYYQK